MKILYVTTVGSTMGFFKSLIYDLLQNGASVDIATNIDASSVPQCYYEWGCNVFNISTSRSPFSLGNFRAIKQIRKLAKNYDIVHCHTPLASMAARIGCRRLRKKRGLKLIYTAHGFHFYTGSPIMNWIVYYPIEKICSRWTDAIITINKEDYELSRKRFSRCNNLMINGIGIDYHRFHNCKIDINAKREELNIPLSSFVVISVGELNDNKNHKVVIEAISKTGISDIHYIIAGKGSINQKLKELAEKLGVNLHLLGSRDDVDELFRASNLNAFPSIREGFGLAAVEGMASGLPLVCGDNRGTRCYAIDGMNSIICKKNTPEEYSNAIKRFYYDRELLNKMSINSVETAKKFDRSSTNKLIKDLYFDILNRS